MVNSDIWTLQCMKFDNINKKEKLQMYHGVQNISSKN